MIPPLHALPPHVSLLLDALSRPPGVDVLGEEKLDLLARTARSARLLADLAVRCVDCGIELDAQRPFGRQLRGALAEASYRRHRLLFEAERAAQSLQPIGAPIVLLKGAAYAAQALPMARGRLPRDLDLMVPKSHLEAAERILREAGAAFDGELTDYDQHYYRAWSHELPPLRLPGQSFEVDLHHTILPPIGRLRPDAARLIADSLPVPGTPFRVLRPADQLLHAAAHLFQDSDCAGRLRDLVDIDGLVRHFSSAGGENFWREVADSAALHGLGRPLWYSLAFCREWLRTPVDERAAAGLDRFAPPAAARALLTTLVARVLPPLHPDDELGLVDRWARSALELRAVWLRMPPWILAYHAAYKLGRALRRSPAQASA